jgi:hypothetical protein
MPCSRKCATLEARRIREWFRRGALLCRTKHRYSPIGCVLGPSAMMPIFQPDRQMFKGEHRSAQRVMRRRWSCPLFRRDRSYRVRQIKTGRGNMRYWIIAFVFVLVASSQSALADQKKPKGDTKPTTDPPIVNNTLTTGVLIGRNAPKKTGPIVRSTNNPALQGNIGTLGGSTGPTKPPLPTTGTQHR